MSKCAVLNCRKSRYRAGKTKVELVIHTFPQQDDLYRSWVQFCRQKETWVPTGYFGICSYHFRNEDYQMENTPFAENRKRSRILFPNAIPSIFESPPYSACAKKVENVGADRQMTSNIEIEPVFAGTAPDCFRTTDPILLQYRDKFCRTCLNHYEDSRLVPVESQLQNMTVLDMLIQITAFETENNEAFPTVVCLDCANKLELAFNIRQQFIEQSELLVQLVAEEKLASYLRESLVASGEYAESLAAEETTKDLYDDGPMDEGTGGGAEQTEHNNQEQQPADNQLAEPEFIDEAYEKCSTKSEPLDTSNHSEPEVQRQTRSSAKEITKKRKGYRSRDNFSLNSEVTQKRRAEILREKARGYSLVSNRKKYKLETDAQKRFPFTTCYVCDKTHATLMDRDFHMREHNGMLPYSCTDCASSNTNDDDDQAAENGAKNQPKLLKTMNQLNIHFRMHRMAYKCEKCYRRFCTELKLKNHYWSSHGIAENGLTCEYCGKQYFNRTVFTRHVAYHRNELSGQFKCTMCDRSFGSKCSLHRHEASHKGEKKFKCAFCEKLFSTSYNRLTHQRVVHTGERPYKCNECGRGFIDNTRLKLHQEIHNSAEPGGKYRTRKAVLLPPGKDRCPYPDCDFTAPTYSLMYRHRRKKHMCVLQCDVCNMSFAYQDDLKHHMMLHTGEKPFKCEKCDRCFRHVKMYRRHMQTHEPSTRSYVCSLCSKSFKMARYLQAHMLTHSAERKFACDLCRVSYKAKSELKRHRQHKHADISRNETTLLLDNMKPDDTQGGEYFITELI